MIRRILLFIALMVGLCSVGYSRGHIAGTATYSMPVTTSGVNSSNQFQRVLRGALVTVFVSGTTNLAVLYSDRAGTPKSNAFSASSVDGSYSFYTDTSAVSIQYSGITGVPTITWGDIPVVNTTNNFTVMACGGSNDTAALAAANSSGGTLEIPFGVTCASNTQSLSVALQIDNGGLLKPITGQTVTLTGPQLYGTWQVFTNALSGQGTVSFANNLVLRDLYADWWGVAGDNADHITQLQASSDALATFATFSGYHRLLLPAGKIKISNSWTIQFVEGVEITGTGIVGQASDSTARACTHLIWSGAAGGTMMVVNGVGYSHFHDLAFHAQGVADIGIDNDQRVGYTRINTQNIYERILIAAEGTRTGFVGIWIAKTAPSNCEGMVLDHVWVESSTAGAYNTVKGTGLQIGNFAGGLGAGGNSFGNRFKDCSWQNGAFGVDAQAGQFSNVGGFENVNGVSFRILSGNHNYYLIQGVNDEGSGQFIVVEQGASVEVTGNRVDLNTAASALAMLSKAAASGSLTGGTGAHWNVHDNTFGADANRVNFDASTSTTLHSDGNRYPNRTGAKFNLSSFQRMPLFGPGDEGQGAADPTFGFYTSITFLTSTGVGATVGISATNYTTFGGPPTFNATESLRQFAIPTPIGGGGGGVLRSLAVRTSTAQPGAGSLVVTLRVNGADQAMTVTFGAGSGATTRTDAAHPLVLAAGDLVSFKFVNNDGAAVSAAVVEITCEYDPI